MAKTAIIIGATGLTGGLLLQGLLEDNRYQKIRLFSRKSCNIKHPKIEEHLVDLFELEKQQHLFIADEVFCCIGTTKAKTPNEEQYLKIDYAIPAALARLCRKMGIHTFLVISAWRPLSHILVFTSNKRILTQLSLLWGVRAFYYDKYVSTDETIEDVNNIACKMGYLEEGDMLVSLAAMPIQSKGMVNTLRVTEITSCPI